MKSGRDLIKPGRAQPAPVCELVESPALPAADWAESEFSLAQQSASPAMSRHSLEWMVSGFAARLLALALAPEVPAAAADCSPLMQALSLRPIVARPAASRALTNPTHSSGKQIARPSSPCPVESRTNTLRRTNTEFSYAI